MRYHPSDLLQGKENFNYYLTGGLDWTLGKKDLDADSGRFTYEPLSLDVVKKDSKFADLVPPMLSAAHLFILDSDPTSIDFRRQSLRRELTALSRSEAQTRAMSIVSRSLLCFMIRSRLVTKSIVDPVTFSENCYSNDIASLELSPNCFRRDKLTGRMSISPHLDKSDPYLAEIAVNDFVKTGVVSAARELALFYTSCLSLVLAFTSDSGKSGTPEAEDPAESGEWDDLRIKIISCIADNFRVKKENKTSHSQKHPINLKIDIIVNMVYEYLSTSGSDIDYFYRIDWSPSIMTYLPSDIAPQNLDELKARSLPQLSELFLDFIEWSGSRQERPLHEGSPAGQSLEHLSPPSLGLIFTQMVSRAPVIKGARTLWTDNAAKGAHQPLFSRTETSCASWSDIDGLLLLTRIVAETKDKENKLTLKKIDYYIEVVAYGKLLKSIKGMSAHDYYKLPGYRIPLRMSTLQETETFLNSYISRVSSLASADLTNLTPLPKPDAFAETLNWLRGSDTLSPAKDGGAQSLEIFNQIKVRDRFVKSLSQSAAIVGEEKDVVMLVGTDADKWAYIDTARHIFNIATKSHRLSHTVLGTHDLFEDSSQRVCSIYSIRPGRHPINQQMDSRFFIPHIRNK